MSDIELEELIAMDQAELEENNAAANAAHVAEAALIEEQMQAEEDAFQAWVAEHADDEIMDFDEFDIAAANNGVANDNFGWNPWVAPWSPIYSDISVHPGTKSANPDLFESNSDAKKHNSLSRRNDQ